MAKKKATPMTNAQLTAAKSLAANESMMKLMLNNATTLRREVISRLLDPKKDINYECGYPDRISTNDYRNMYEREGVAARVVTVWPEESWALLPEIYETEDVNQKTEFEKAWVELENQMHCLHYLQRIDSLSGIGRFGVLLLGLDDGKELSAPVQGIDLKTGKSNGNVKRKLLYLKAFDESAVDIASKETDVTSPRYGYPVTYTIRFESNTSDTISSSSTTVHWTRVLHVADNRECSEVYGVPRMKNVYNRLLDIRKVLSGSGEMFWKGGFPGYALEVNPELGDVEVDTESLKDQLESYMNGLQRYIALTGVTAKSLQPQVADPRGHIMAHLQAIAISISIPQRILFGSEAAKLASTEDAATWNQRVGRRQEGYLSPMLIRPFVDKLIAFGVLPEPKTYYIDWPDLNTPSDSDKATIAEARSRALATYITGGVDTIIPPMEFLTMILGMTQDEAMAIQTAALVYLKDQNVENDNVNVQPGNDNKVTADALKTE